MIKINLQSLLFFAFLIGFKNKTLCNNYTNLPNQNIKTTLEPKINSNILENDNIKEEKTIEKVSEKSQQRDLYKQIRIFTEIIKYEQQNRRFSYFSFFTLANFILNIFLLTIFLVDWNNKGFKSFIYNKDVELKNKNKKTPWASSRIFFHIFTFISGLYSLARLITLLIAAITQKTLIIKNNSYHNFLNPNYLEKLRKNVQSSIHREKSLDKKSTSITIKINEKQLNKMLKLFILKENETTSPYLVLDPVRISLFMFLIKQKKKFYSEEKFPGENIVEENKLIIKTIIDNHIFRFWEHIVYFNSILFLLNTGRLVSLLIMNRKTENMANSMMHVQFMFILVFFCFLFSIVEINEPFLRLKDYKNFRSEIYKIRRLK